MPASPIPRELVVCPTVRSFRHFLRHVGAIVLAVFLGRARWDSRHPTAAAAWSIAPVAVVVTALMLPAVAEAYRGDGVFTLAEGRWLPHWGGGGDVVVLPDGSVVGVGGWRPAWRMTPDGQRSSIPGLSGTGLAATADGGVLAIQAKELFEPRGADQHRIVRWTPGVGVSVVAGTGRRGFGGDGRPATEALLNLTAPSEVDPTGIVARADGGFVFTDTGNHRIRAVDAAGTIRTIAGGSAKFGDPVGVATTPDGGHIVTDPDGRVRRIGSDGTIETVARLSYGPSDVVVSADGTVVLSKGGIVGGQLWRLEPGSRRFRPYLRPERPTDTFDFAARSTFGEGIALDRYGGLLAVGAIKRELPVVRGALRYVANGPTPWTMVALRSTRMSRRGVTAVIEATKPGTATLEIARDDRIIARDTRPVAAGHATLHAVGPIRSDWYDVRLQLQGADGAIARDDVPIHGAPALTVRLARRLLWRRQGSDDSGFYSLGRDCQRFGQGRVDCSITTDPGRNIGVASITLERSGVVLRRHYLWGRSGFRRHPRFIASDGVQRLSRDDRGRWASD